MNEFASDSNDPFLSVLQLDLLPDTFPIHPHTPIDALVAFSVDPPPLLNHEASS